MEFRIADTFTDSLADLSNQEQKRVKTTAFDLQMDPARPGMQLHRIDRSKDDNFWSARVSSDLRLIVHRTNRSFLLCYVGHHDDAYDWAERRKIERHPKTGAAQIVEVRETVREIPVYVARQQPAEAEKETAPSRSATPPALLFEDVPEEDLLAYGVPTDWVEAVKGATEDTLLDLAERLPAEAAEALLDLATGTTPTVVAPAGEDEDPFEHPDAQRRFRTVEDRDELERALDFPWDKWAVFLHPSQRDIVTRSYSGPARVAGSAGTGKTVVALHRAVYLAEQHPDTRVLLTTFSDPLARMLRDKLRTLVSNRPRLAEQIDVVALGTVALRLYQATQRSAAGVEHDRPQIATLEQVATLLADVAAAHAPHGFSPTFLLAEWRHVVDAWQLTSWEDYRSVPRVGRRSRLVQSKREILWAMFEDLRNELAGRGMTTMPSVYGTLADHYGNADSPYDFVVVDEAQDIGVAQLRFLAALAADRADGLFFAGDLGQRIFQPPFSWLALGVDVRGRSRTLKINYRTSHQIRRQADRLLAPELADVDGVTESRRGTMSVFNGPPPEVYVFGDPEAEIDAVATWLGERVAEGVAPDEIGVIVRSQGEMERAKRAVSLAGLPHRVLDDHTRPGNGQLSISTMHLAKGLEFRAVVVMACDDEVLPLQTRIENIADEADLEEVYNTERHLLYVACTRARDNLIVTASEPGSEFLDDLIA